MLCFCSPCHTSSRTGSSAETFRFVDHSPAAITAASASAGRSSTSPGLIKQTYSAFVHNSVPGGKPRKWHLTAYLTYADVSQLPTIDLDPTLRAIVIPSGMYRSAKARSRQVDLENTYASDTSRAGGPAHPVRLASPYPQLPAGFPASPTSPAPHQAFAIDYQTQLQAHSPQQQQAMPRYPYAQVPLQGQMSQQQQMAQYPASQYASAQYAATMSAAERAAQDRLAEDQRVISMLNARTHM